MSHDYNHWALVWMDIWKVAKYIVPPAFWFSLGFRFAMPKEFTLEPDVFAFCIFVAALLTTYWSYQ